MQLQGEDDMVLMRRMNGADSPMEDWKRCQPVS
jgi:hypothetical protein